MREGQPPPDTQQGETPLPSPVQPEPRDRRAISEARPRHSRSWRGPALAWGVLLGGLQLLLLLVFLIPGILAGMLPGILVGDDVRPLTVLFSAGGYFAFAMLAGIRASLRGGDTGAGVGAGCLVGTIGVLTVAIPAVALALIQLAAPHAECLPPSCRNLLNPASVGVAIALLAGLLVLGEGFCALVACSLGGCMGSLFGERMASRRAE
jgi:hypothetical protein